MPFHQIFENDKVDANENRDVLAFTVISNESNHWWAICSFIYFSASVRFFVFRPSKPTYTYMTKREREKGIL